MDVLFLPLVFIFLTMVLVSALRQPREIAFRMTCSKNLSAVGKAIMIYDGSGDGLLPRAGGPASTWAARIPNWRGKDRFEAYGMDRSGVGGQASVSASLYLPVKYSCAPPKWFLCPAEESSSEFRPSLYGVADEDLIDLWDFGPNPPQHCSYAYGAPYGPGERTAFGPPGMPIVADRNPWIDASFAPAGDFSLFKPDIRPFNGKERQARHGNTFSHQGDGQNVLFLDSHVEFVKRPWCGFDNDNIYTSWDGEDKIRGTPPEVGSIPAGRTDSLLVNDPIRP